MLLAARDNHFPETHVHDNSRLIGVKILMRFVPEIFFLEKFLECVEMPSNNRWIRHRCPSAIEGVGGAQGEISTEPPLESPPPFFAQEFLRWNLIILFRKSISKFYFFQKAPFSDCFQFCRVSNSKTANLEMPHYDFYYFPICLERCISFFFQIFCLFWSESPFQNSIFFKKPHFWTVRNFAASQTQKRQILKCLIMIFIISLYA